MQFPTGRISLIKTTIAHSPFPLLSSLSNETLLNIQSPIPYPLKSSPTSKNYLFTPNAYLESGSSISEIIQHYHEIDSLADSILIFVYIDGEI